jgi:non-specific serine/threonine protein kinase
LLLLNGAVLGWLTASHGDAEQLATLLGASQLMDETIGAAPGSITELSIDEAGAGLQVRMGKANFEEARRRGRRLSFAQVAELVSRTLSQASASSPGTQRPQHSSLSKREGEVLDLVAEGLSNKEIARRLIVSENTVKTHVTSLFNKLGVYTRAQAVAVAARRGFLEPAAGGLVRD